MTTSNFQKDRLELQRLLDTLIRNVHSDPVKQFIQFYEILMNTRVIHWESQYLENSRGKMFLRIPDSGIIGYWFLTANEEPIPEFSLFSRSITTECINKIQQIFATEYFQVREVISQAISNYQK